MNTMTESNKGGMALALLALFIGIAALPVAAFVSIPLGLIMLSLPVFLIYMAS